MLEEESHSTCSPNLAKLADKIEGETMISLFENLSTREVASTTGIVALALRETKKKTRVRSKFISMSQRIYNQSYEGKIFSFVRFQTQREDNNEIFGLASVEFQGNQEFDARRGEELGRCMSAPGGDGGLDRARRLVTPEAALHGNRLHSAPSSHSSCQSHRRHLF